MKTALIFEVNPLRNDLSANKAHQVLKTMEINLIPKESVLKHDNEYFKKYKNESIVSIRHNIPNDTLNIKPNYNDTTPLHNEIFTIQTIGNREVYVICHKNLMTEWDLKIVNDLITIDNCNNVQKAYNNDNILKKIHLIYVSSDNKNTKESLEPLTNQTFFPDAKITAIMPQDAIDYTKRTNPTPHIKYLPVDFTNTKSEHERGIILQRALKKLILDNSSKTLWKYEHTITELKKQYELLKTDLKER